MTATGSPGTWKPELLERDDQVAQLEDLLDRAQTATGGVVLVEAAAGLGKTRLLDRIRRRAARLGVRVLAARATELEGELPFGVARQLLEPAVLGAADGRERLLDGPAAAARPALGLGRVTGGEAPAAMDDAEFTTLYGLYWLLTNLSEEGPLLLTVDDAHWADSASLRFLSFLVPRIEELPVLLVVAARPVAEQAAALSHLGVDPAVTRVDIQPLSTDSIAVLLESATGVAPEGPFTAACDEVTAGNPFLLTELARTIRAEGAQPSSASAARVRELLPDSISRSVLGRLAILPSPPRQVARAVAILGDGCELSLVSQLVGIDSDAATDAADALRAADVLDADAELRFVHPLVRKAVYADVPAGARDREHRRAAALLEERGASADRVAVQLLATEPAGDDGTVESLLDGAQAALDRGAADAALACLTRALREPAPEQAYDRMMRIGFATGLQSGPRPRFIPLMATLMTHERVAELIDDPTSLGDQTVILAVGLLIVGRVEESNALFESAVDAAEADSDLSQAVTLDAIHVSMFQVPAPQARERFRRWEGRLGEDTPEQRLSFACNAWWKHQMGGPADEVSALAHRALDRGLLIQEHAVTPQPSQAAIVLVRCDELDAAETAAARMIEAGSSGGPGLWLLLAGGWLVRALCLHRRGELAQAEAEVRQAYDLLRLRDIVHLMPPVTACLARVLVERGETDAAAELLDSNGFDGDLPPLNWYQPLLFSRALIRQAQGRLREAADEFVELRDRTVAEAGASNPEYPPGAYGARVLAALGEPERAQELADWEVAHARRWGAPSVVAEAVAARGAVTPGEAGIELLEEAVALAAMTQARLVHATALSDLGAALRRARRRSDAREPLREALTIARSCGAAPLAQRVASELEATGEHVPRHTPIGAESLTPSERRVAEMAATGMTNREIAAARYVTIKTVESHLRAAYDKLGIRSRGELAAALKPAD